MVIHIKIMTHPYLEDVSKRFEGMMHNRFIQVDENGNLRDETNVMLEFVFSEITTAYNQGREDEYKKFSEMKCNEHIPCVMCSAFAYKKGANETTTYLNGELMKKLIADALTQERVRVVGEIKVRYLKEEAFGANMSDDQLMLNAYANGFNEALSTAISIVKNENGKS